MWFFFVYNYLTFRVRQYLINSARHTWDGGYEMIGLQFITDTFHIEYKTVAEKIVVSKQTLGSNVIPEGVTSLKKSEILMIS